MMFLFCSDDKNMFVVGLKIFFFFSIPLSVLSSDEVICYRLFKMRFTSSSLVCFLLLFFSDVEEFDLTLYTV